MSKQEQEERRVLQEIIHAQWANIKVNELSTLQLKQLNAYLVPFVKTKK